jgi:MSHA biogenesis protein MshG
MSRFRYEGRDKLGKRIEGFIDGSNETAVALQLIRTGVSPISIAPYVEKENTMTSIEYYFKFNYPSLNDLAFLSRQMYSMTRAGMPIVNAVRVVLESSKNPQLKVALTDVIASIEAGQSLGVAMRQHPDVFPTLMISLIIVGENTGSLDKVFLQLSTHFEREVETRRRVKAVLRYPTIVMIVIAVAILIINILVIPAFGKFFSQFHVQLPLPTRIILGFSSFMVNYWYLLLAGIITLIASIISYVRTPEGHYKWDKVKISIPLFGKIIQRTILARFARTFALCIRTGVPLLETIALIADATDNLYMNEQIMAMKTRIEHGESLTIAAANSKMFTGLVMQMFSIGEESGELDRLLDEVADYYEQEVDYDIKRLGDAIEPFILVVLGAIVLVLALGVYLPMWDLWKISAGKGG